MSEARLRAWLGERLGASGDVRIADNDARTAFGYSNETRMLDVAWHAPDGDHEAQLVLRLPPAGEGGLLAPYDIARQFHVMRCLAPSPVPVPSVLWLEETGAVLGRPFFVMERIHGAAFEIGVPPPFDGFDTEQRRAMGRRSVTEIAQLAGLDWRALGLGFLGDGEDSLTRERERWVAYFAACRAPSMPGFDLVIDWLRTHQPEPTPRIALVHGDAKWGNFMWSAAGEVVGLLDWEMSLVGDPLLDLGYYLTITYLGGAATPSPMGAGLTREEVVALYEELTGLAVHDLPWYEALTCFKLAAITYRMVDMFVSEETDDLRFLFSGHTARMFITMALRAIGADPETELGIVAVPPARAAAAVAAVTQGVIVPSLTSPYAAEQAVLAAQAMASVAAGDG